MALTLDLAQGLNEAVLAPTHIASHLHALLVLRPLRQLSPKHQVLDLWRPKAGPCLASRVASCNVKTETHLLHRHGLVHYLLQLFRTAF